MPSQALRILIVEDQLLIARQLEMIAKSAGHEIVGIAATEAEACSLALAFNPDIVFVDISLAKGSNGMDVATFIAERSDAHVVFTTANRRRLPQDYCGAVGLVEKPFTRAGLLSAINYVAARIKNDCKSLVKPESLQLSPAYSMLWRPSA
jgi:AmiR/NasT family two-component response regulator